MATLTAVRQHQGNRISFPRVTRPAVSAGTTVFLAYIFAGLTIQVGVLTQLGISGPEASNWFFITWMTTGLFSLVLSLFTKQPEIFRLRPWSSSLGLQAASACPRYWEPTWWLA